MKCLACGAEMAAPVKFCEYCGSAVTAAAGGVAPARAVQAAPAQPASAPAGTAESLWPQPSDPIFRLWNAPAAHPIRWLAFFFPLAWLAGYGALRAAIGLALVFIAGDLASRLVGVVHAGAAGLLFVAFMFFYSYKVAVNAERLAPVRGPFHWGAAIGFTIAYVVAVVLLQLP